MNLKSCLAASLFAGYALITPAHATTLTYLGSDLVGVATFPAQQPVVTGTSLFFAPSNALFYIHDIVDLPLPPLSANVEQVVLRIGLTRPICVQASGCAGTSDDFDPVFGLADGTSLLSGALSDLISGSTTAVIAGAQWLDTGASYAAVSSGPWAYLALPGIAEPFEMSVVYDLTGSGTAMEIAYGNDATTFQTPTTLDGNNLRFVYVRDNDPGEQIQIDWVSIEYVTASTPVAVDIKPGSCPNPLNTESAKGVVSVAINGDATINVTDIDPASVRLAGVAPLRSAYQDVSTPYTPYIGKTNRLDCHAAGDDDDDDDNDDTLSDGLLDLVFKFDRASLIAALGGSNLTNGTTIVVPLTGTLRDGTPIVGEDVVWIRAGDNDD